jgi:cytochrome c peroxidase
MRRAIPIAALLVGLGCDAREPDEEAALRELLGVPDHFVTPAIPAGNPPTAEKIALGRHLFYDRRLSANQTQSCADCHLQALAFADGLVTPTGSTGTLLERNSQGLTNVAYLASLTWANDGLIELEQQIHIPLTADAPIELGVTDGVRDEVLARFEQDPEYAAMFAAAFPELDGEITLDHVVFALASFLRTMISGDSPYDRFLNGDDAALTEQQKLGMSLFDGERFECFHCHGGIDFTAAYRSSRREPANLSFVFFNNGLYDVDGEGSYPAHDQGLYDLTFDPDDRGRFRPPSLRNVALTGPYMHDGSIATLREVVEHYAAGGRLITAGPNAGDGRLSPLKSGLVRGFEASDAEIDAVVAFLESLTDERFVTNPALSNPFE